MLELAVWWCLATLLTMMPVHVGVSIAPVNSNIHSSGINKNNVLTKPMGNAKMNAEKPKAAHSLMALSKFSPLYPPFKSEK